MRKVPLTLPPSALARRLPGGLGLRLRAAKVAALTGGPPSGRRLAPVAMGSAGTGISTMWE